MSDSFDVQTCQCSFCGSDVFSNEIVSSELSPDYIICYNCVETLHYFYLQHVLPIRQGHSSLVLPNVDSIQVSNGSNI